MPFIQDLTLLQQAQAGAGAMLVLLLALVVVRRRRRAAPESAPAEPARASRLRMGGARGGPSVPRRKRRKLAAEAAHAIGTNSVAAATAPDAPAEIVVPPVEMPVEPDPGLIPRDEASAVVVDDPYVSEGVDDGDAVAQPGWPTPGELVSTFDPDAFDPLPEADEAADAAVDLDQPTGVIEMPLDMGSGAADSEEWEDDFDPATGWGAGQAHEPQEDPVESWADEADDLASSAGSDGPWQEPEDEPAWSASSELELVTPADSDPGVAEAPEHVDWSDGAAEAACDVEASDASPLSPWSDDSAHGWSADDEHEATDLAVPFPTPGTMAAHDGTSAVSIPSGNGGQVLLDIAGLAASGRSIELVIEPNDDGRGVRLRIGNPSNLPETGVAEAIATDPAGEIDPSGSHRTSGVPFLEGTVVSEPVTHEIGDEWFGLAVGTIDDWPAVADGPAPEEPGSDPAGPAPAPEADDALVELPASTSVGSDLTSNGEGAMERADDDPATILADIRARLAALDARR